MRRGLFVAACLVTVFLGRIQAQETSAPHRAAAPPAIERWILHFDRRLEEVCASALASLLLALPADARVTVAVPEERDANLFRFAVPIPEALAERVDYTVTGGSMSCWARDRYTIFDRGGQRCVLLQPTPLVHPGWRSDLDAAAGLALEPTTRMRRIASELCVDGGDLLITTRLAYVGVGSVRSNALRLRQTERRVVAELEAILERPVRVIGDDPEQTPHEHIDMVMHALEDGSVIVGDPSLTADAWLQLTTEEAQRVHLDCFGASSAEEQRLAAPAYQRVVTQLRELGVRVHRVPALHARCGDVVLSWTNAVTETRGGVARAYVPSYGLPTLDEVAHAVWRQLGFRVLPVACSDSAIEGGAIRCLTNTIRRPLAGTHRRGGPARPTSPLAPPPAAVPRPAWPR